MEPPLDSIVPRRKLKHIYHAKDKDGDKVRCEIDIILVDDKIAFFKTFVNKKGQEVTVREAMTYDRFGYHVQQ